MTILTRAMRAPTLAVIIVSYRSAEALATTVPALLRELRPDDELIVVDNASGDGTVAAVKRLAPVARLIANDTNLGFPAACNQGAQAAGGDLLVFLNPDAVPQPGWGEAIRAPFGGGWAAWQGLVTQDGGRIVNSSGNV